MNEDEQDKLKWWAQQLMQAYVRIKKERDSSFRALPADWNDETKWSTIAAKLIEWRVQSTPTECMHVLFGSSKKPQGPRLFELNMLLADPLIKCELAAHDLNEDEFKEMREFGLDPESMKDRSLYATMYHIRYWTLPISRSSGSTDVKSREFLDKVCLQLIPVPAWVAYAFNPNDPEIAETFRVKAEDYYRLHPDTGDALILMGHSKAIIFPQGHPCDQ